MGVTTVEEKDGLMKAVMAAKAMQANEKEGGQTAESAEKEIVYVENGTVWKDMMAALQTEIEKELGKANAVCADVIAKEKETCKANTEKEYKQMYEDKLTALAEEKDQEKEAIVKEKDEEIEALKNDHSIELEKMKNLYEQQLNEAAESFRDKNQQLRKEMDRYKEQIEMLMLHIDDPFVLQEIQMKQEQSAAGSQQEAAEEEATAESGADNNAGAKSESEDAAKAAE